MKAYDMLVQAESGLCSITGSPQEDGRIGVSACDIGTGLYAHAAILEALYARERGGEGRSIKLSMFGAMADWMAVPLLRFDYAGDMVRRTGLSHPMIQPYGTVRRYSSPSRISGNICASATRCSRCPSSSRIRASATILPVARTRES
jgi:crotonobetainyl-CoA:carnitine CoA-transferase CaiB-like acyl-CoA transferase